MKDGLFVQSNKRIWREGMGTEKNLILMEVADAIDCAHMFPIALTLRAKDGSTELTRWITLPEAQTLVDLLMEKITTLADRRTEIGYKG